MRIKFHYTNDNYVLSFMEVKIISNFRVKEYFWFINKQTIMMTHSKNLFLIIVLATMSVLGTTSKSFGQRNLDIKVTNIKKNAGKIIVEIYENKSEWLKKPYKKVVLQTNQEVQVASFNVPYGKYAITIYQDLNNNSESDMNFLSIPKEPIGFGNNYHPFGEPKFESCAIEFNASSQPQIINLYKVY